MKPETDVFGKLKIAFSEEYSTKRAIQLLYKLYSQADDMITEADIQERLRDKQDENEFFFVEAVDWSIVLTRLEKVADQFHERIKHWGSPDAF